MDPAAPRLSGNVGRHPKEERGWKGNGNELGRTAKVWIWEVWRNSLPDNHGAVACRFQVHVKTVKMKKLIEISMHQLD